MPFEERESDQKIFQIRMDRQLFERFYAAFPGRGERKLLLERVIELLVARKDKKDLFIRSVLDEAKERFSSLEGEEDW